MSEFIVSARKYRPATFDTVVGQLSITKTLKNSISNKHLGQAYLFCGPRGVGKTTCARIFAKTINCQNLTDDIEACNKCESCKAFNESSSYNIHELDAASNNSVEDIRQLIEQVRIPPQIGRYSIYIIDEVHMLSSAAFNAFLKTLEEPPKHAIFILATTEKHKILPTILSRCQIFDFNRIKVEDAAAHLMYVAEKEGVTAEAEAMNVIALKADGAMRDALSIFDQIVSFCGNNITYKDTIDNLNILDYEYYFKLVDYFLNEDYVNSLIVFDEILDKGFDGHNFLNGLSGHFRDLLVSKDAITLQLLEVGASIKEHYKQQANTCTVDFLMKALDLSNKFDLNYKASKNKRLHVELALLQFCSILKKKDNTEVTATEQAKANQASEEKKSTIKTSEGLQKPKSAGFSFKDIVAGKAKSEEKTASPEQKTTQDSAPLQRDELSEDTLKKTWNEYVNSVANNPRFNSIMSACEPKLMNNSVIQIAFASKTQSDFFKNEIYPDIQKILTEKLNNSAISLNVIVNEHTIKTENKPISSQDKYNYLLEKNPNLSKLRDKFDLDIN